MQIGFLKDISVAKKITPTQLKLIVAWVVVLLLFFGAFVCVLRPRQKQLEALKLRTHTLEKEVQFVDRYVPKNLSPQDTRNKLRDMYRQMNKKRAPTVPAITKQMSDYARRLGMQLISISAQTKATLVDNEGYSIKLDGSEVQVFDMKIELKSTYANLVKYLDIISRLAPAYVTYEKLRIVGGDAAADRQRVSLELKVYTLG